MVTPWRIVVVMAAMVAIASAGCSRGPKEMCEKYEKLSAGKPFNMAECVKSTEKLKTKDPTAYECTKKCFDADTLEAFDSCGRDCFKGAAAATPAKTASGDCPNGTACMNRCKTECESKYGPLVDVAAIRACNQSGGKPAECMSKGTNEAAKTCFLSCRGL